MAYLITLIKITQCDLSEYKYIILKFQSPSLKYNSFVLIINIKYINFRVFLKKNNRFFVQFNTYWGKKLTTKNQTELVQNRIELII